MEIVQINTERYNYLLKTNESRFYISDLVYEIILLLKQQKSNQEIANQLYNEGHLDAPATTTDIESIKETYLRPMGILDDEGQLYTSATNEQAEEQPRKAIMFQLRLLNQAQIAKITPYFEWLFQPRFFNWLLPITAVVNLILGIQFYQQVDNYIDVKSFDPGSWASWGYVALYYPTAILVLLLHELGHATPANFYKTPPKSIGFGFYLVFPVFFADVTAVWQLNKKKRMIVNIGGIYVQMIVNALLLLALPYLPLSGFVTAVVFALINLNFLTLFLNLNPFFKFDGYWLYSDFFDLPNLHRKAASYLRSLIFRNDVVAERELQDYKTPWLKIYAVLYVAFLVFLFYALAQGFLFSVDALGDAFAQLRLGDYQFASIFQFIFLLVTIGVIIVVVHLRIRYFYLSFLTKNSRV